jgi:transcriptional regulator with XRE-family HTH domain
MDNKKIGKFLFNKRKEESKTQKEVADELNVTYQAVSRWENGDSIPDIETLCKIADMYHVSVDEILQRDPKQNEKSQMLLLALMSAFVYLIAIAVFLVIDYYWVTFFGTLLFALFIFAGLLPTNIYYFSELQIKSKKDTIIYLFSYLPAIMGIIFVVFTWL